MSNLIPVAMTRAELLSVLVDISIRVETGDSDEGNLEWALPEPDDPTGGDFLVRGVYRVGNLQGQGGIRMIGTVPA